MLQGLVKSAITVGNTDRHMVKGQSTQIISKNSLILLVKISLKNGSFVIMKNIFCQTKK